MLDSVGPMLHLLARTILGSRHGKGARETLCSYLQTDTVCDGDFFLEYTAIDDCTGAQVK